MNKEKVFIEGYEVEFLSGTDGTREKKIQVASGEIVSIDEHFIYKSIEPEKPVVKQFVADWYEECKDNLEYNLWNYIYNWGTKEECDFKNWLDLGRNNPIQTLINMHQFGYEVEKEKRYLVKLKAVDQYLVSVKDEKFLGFLQSRLRSEFTRKQLEDAGFGEVFNSTLFEVEEVTE